MRGTRGQEDKEKGGIRGTRVDQQMRDKEWMRRPGDDGDERYKGQGEEVEPEEQGEPQNDGYKGQDRPGNPGIKATRDTKGSG